MSSAPTRELANFVVSLREQSIPASVLERTKDLLLDTLACAVAGHQGDETGQIEALARATGQGDSSIIGGGRLSPVGATLLNAYLITAVTACDVHRPSFCHITPEVVPPALAIAEQVGASGRELLTALVAGLETTTRIGIGINYPAFRQRGWHAPGVIGPFGGAAAVGSLLKLDAERQLLAFGLAGSQSAGTFAAWGTPTVKFHQARGAVSGLLAALLGEQGFRASEAILEAPDGGILSTYSDGGQPDAITANFGSHWELENISLRLWPTASSIQSVITAVFGLIEKYDVRPDNIERVKVGLSKTVYDLHGMMGWEGKFRALLSTRYVVAVVLADRRCWLDQFAPERIADPALDQFARTRVQVEVDPSVQGSGAVVEITDRQGRTVVDRREVPKGDAADPLTRAEIIDKLRLASQGGWTDRQVEQVIDLVSHLEDVEQVDQLCEVLRAPEPVLA